MEKLKKLPISKLVFYETYPESSKYTEEEVKKVLEKKLISKYKLYPEQAQTFIEKEQNVILKRGSNLDDYLFGKKKNLEEVIELFCEVISSNEEENFENFTLSEYLLYAMIFTRLASRCKKKYKILNQIMEEIMKEESIICCDDSIHSFEKEIQNLKEIKIEIVREREILENLVEIDTEYADILNKQAISRITKNGSFRDFVFLVKEMFIVSSQYEKRMDYSVNLEETVYQKMKNYSKKKGE